MKRSDYLERVRAVEREFEIAREAAKLLEQAARSTPGLLFGGRLSRADARMYIANLESTYLIRMFAAYEIGLRDVWQNAMSRRSRPATELLIDRIAAKFTVPDDNRIDVHSVRVYRNFLIHEKADEVKAVALDTARGVLCKFLSRLPTDW